MSKYSYDGNVVRKIEREERNFQSVPRRKSNKKAITFAGVLGFVVATGVVIMGFTSFIKAQADVTNLREELASAMSAYESAKLENDLYEKRIESNINLANIEQIAMTELGMTLAGAGQIEFYDSDIEDYVKQYEELPK